MRQRQFLRWLPLLLALSLLAGCGTGELIMVTSPPAPTEALRLITDTPVPAATPALIPTVEPSPLPEPSPPLTAEPTPTPEPIPDTLDTDTPVPAATPALIPTVGPSPSPEPSPPTTAEPTPVPDPTPDTLDEDGAYTTPEEVAEYLHTYGKLPGNFITKSDARNLGWDSSQGNLWDVAPGMSIGGDRFGNYERALPQGRYRECDVNYTGGYRGGERIIYGEDGSIYYTADHYNTFTQLY